MTSGTAGRTSTWWGMVMAGTAALLASCNVAPLKPAWQQDPNLYHQGFPARTSQTSPTPHLVARVIYAQPDRIAGLLRRQGDVVDTQGGLARIGDGTIDLGFQDVASGQWIESHLCGGNLFVVGLPNQAYRVVLKNRTPMPLEIRVGVDGKDVRTGATAGVGRGGMRLEPKATLTLDHTPRGPLLFKPVSSDAALFDISPQGRAGLIQIAVYLAADAPSIGPEKLRPDMVAPLGLYPMGIPEQYR